MNKLIAILFLLFPFASQADSNLQLLGGFSSGAIGFGADYEIKKSETFGFGGYFFYSAEGDDLGPLAPQVIAAGALARLHLLDTPKYNVSTATGFGVIMSEFEIAGQDQDDTTFGPMLKLGMLYKLSPKLAVGGEMFTIYNWLSDENFGSLEYFNVVVRLKL